MRDIQNEEDNREIPLEKVGVKKVSLAGFDGYKQNHSNYYRKGYEMSIAENAIDNRNQQMTDALSIVSKYIKIEFLTSTLYSVK